VSLPIVYIVAKGIFYAGTSAVAFALTRMTSPDRLYAQCVRAASILAWPLGERTRRLLAIIRPDPRSVILQHILCVATRHGGVAVRVRVENTTLLEDTWRRHGRLLLCTAHLGLTMAIQRVLHERGIPLQIIGQPPRADGLHWGCPQPATIITSNTHCLVRARRALAQGHALLAYPDMVAHASRTHAYYVRRNLFRFAIRTRTPVLFFDARQEKDGAILVHFARPRPHLNGDGQARAFCDFLRTRTGLPFQLEPDTPNEAGSLASAAAQTPAPGRTG
jgi:hypothetical protein